MSNITISAATVPERDWAAGVLAGSDPWITLGVSLEQCLRNCHDTEFEIYIAHYGSESCGVLILDPRGMAGSPYIKSVAVAESYRGFQVGTKLLEFTEGICRKHSRHLFLCVSSFNPGARRFYERHGFAAVGELTDYIIKGASETIMHKLL